MRNGDIEVPEEGKGRTTYEQRNPWGYVVCLGTVVTFIAGIGHVNSFGLIYNDFMTDTCSTANSLTTAHGVFAIMLAVGGIILNFITRTKSLRFGGLIGAFFFVLGSFLTIPITNTNQLPFTFGVLQGMGFGMLVPVCYGTINHYFIKKRTTVMSFCKALQSVMQMIYPQTIKRIQSLYGFRGTLIIISGISLHTIPGTLVMITNWKNRKRIARDAEDIKTVAEKSDLLKTNEADINPEVEDVKMKTNRFNILDILNLKVLKDPVFCNICFCQAFVNFSDLMFFILQPMLLFQYSYSKTQVATCISVGAAADLAGRCTLAVISTIMSVDTRLLFYASTLLTTLLRLVMLQSRQFLWMILITGALGMLRSWIHIASPLIISNHVRHEDFPGAYALFMLAAGLVHVTLGPIMGVMKDINQDYVPTFYALTFCCAPCLISWPIEHFMRRTK